MRIIVNGSNGAMGKVLSAMIEKSAEHQIAAKVDLFNGEYSCLQDYQGDADIIIDFSNHASTENLMAYAVERNLPVVVCTTGHNEAELQMIKDASAQIPVFHSGNMSLGIAVLGKLAMEATRMFPDADIEIMEVHHNRKLDVPSGTALMLANKIKVVREDCWFNVGRHSEGKRDVNEIGIHSLRMGNVVGIHEIRIATQAQIITLKHEAQSRDLFAEGALSAAAYLVGREAGLYNMDDICA